MNISASLQLDEPVKGLSLKWAGEDIEVITNWLIARDSNEERFLQHRGIVRIVGVPVHTEY